MRECLADIRDLSLLCGFSIGRISTRRGRSSRSGSISRLNRITTSDSTTDTVAGLVRYSAALPLWRSSPADGDDRSGLSTAGYASDVAPALQKSACLLIVGPPIDFERPRNICRRTVAHFPFTSTREIGRQIIDFSAKNKSCLANNTVRSSIFPVFSRLCGKIAVETGSHPTG